MILITRATTNTIYATCREKELLTSPSYVIKFTNDATKDYRYCKVTDTSTYPIRYQSFSIVETTSPTQLSNQVKLDNSRSWKYKIFECTAAYLATLTLWTQFSETGLTTVETGRVKVLKTATTLNTYAGNQSTFKEYAG